MKIFISATLAFQIVLLSALTIAILDIDTLGGAMFVGILFGMLGQKIHKPLMEDE